MNVNVIQDDLPCLDRCHLAVFALDSSFALEEHFYFSFTWLLSLFSLFIYSAKTTVVCIILLPRLSGTYFEFLYPLSDISLENQTSSAFFSFGSKASNSFPHLNMQ